MNKSRIYEVLDKYRELLVHYDAEYDYPRFGAIYLAIDVIFETYDELTDEDYKYYTNIDEEI